MNWNRIKDRIEEWVRYKQPTRLQKQLLGLFTDSFDLDFTARRLATEDSARYMTENMRQAEMFHVDYDLHSWVTSQVDKQLLDEGLVLEFGVATGRTINHFARQLPNKTVHGFDSFEGLPETWNWHLRKGHFARQKLPQVQENVELHVGWFDNTLPEFVATHEGPVAFLHIDSDLYSSAVTILDQLGDRFRPGTVILFDEYLNYPGWEQDEFRAWQEFVKKHKVIYEYIGVCSTHQKVAVKITKI